MNKSKYLFTFTKSGTGTFTKLRIINEIKTYVTYLIANSSADIYFFSNIEIGSTLNSPHLHTQLWCDDKNAVKAIYDKVIQKFYLDKPKCKLSVPQQDIKFYDYVIKEYSKNLTDDQLWNIETAKRDMRRQLGLKIRFYSKSKSKYANKIYKTVYHSYGVLRNSADSFIDFMINILFVRKSQRDAILLAKSAFVVSSISSFISILRTREQFLYAYSPIMFFEWWIFGMY